MNATSATPASAATLASVAPATACASLRFFDPSTPGYPAQITEAGEIQLDPANVRS
jgi:hypothetical protein